MIRHFTSVLGKVPQLTSYKGYHSIFKIMATIIQSEQSTKSGNTQTRDNLHVHALLTPGEILDNSHSLFRPTVYDYFRQQNLCDSHF